jgi:hypothetical protein
VWWFVVVDALHVACVKGSELICNGALWAMAGSPSVVMAATPMAATRPWNRDFILMPPVEEFVAPTLRS